VRPLSGGTGLRALAWFDLTTRLGLTLPFFLVHDVGMIFAAPREQYVTGPRADLSRDPRLSAPLADYAATLAELSEAEAVRRARQLRLSDELVATLLARLLAVVSSRLTARPAYTPAVPYDTNLFERIDPQLAALHAVTDRSFEVQALATLSAVRLFVLTLADAIDTDTLTLFGLLGADAGAGPLAQVDLLQTFQSPEANDIVNFSLEILPSVLESRPRPAAGTTAAFGYSGVGNRGSVDSMVLSELAWDNDELARRQNRGARQRIVRVVRVDSLKSRAALCLGQLCPIDGYHFSPLSLTKCVPSVAVSSGSDPRITSDPGATPRVYSLRASWWCANASTAARTNGAPFSTVAQSSGSTRSS
jgi:hypothetical protein